MIVSIHNLTNRDVKHEEDVLNNLFKTIDFTKTFQIILVDDIIMQGLNKTYRNIDRSTDVLSFEDTDDDESIGDVFISLDKVLNQSNEYGHSYERELTFLAVHGFLHLQGYDHQTKEDEKKMMELTEEILKKGGYEREIE